MTAFIFTLKVEDSIAIRVNAKRPKNAIVSIAKSSLAKPRKVGFLGHFIDFIIIRKDGDWGF